MLETPSLAVVQARLEIGIFMAEYVNEILKKSIPASTIFRVYGAGL